jgi:hypothetical protein
MGMKPDSPMTQPAPSAQFLLLLRRQLDGPDLSPEAMEQHMGKWIAWMKAMRARGELAGANRLQDQGSVLRGPKAVLSDGPFVEAKEVVCGYLLLNAPDLEAATRIARDCPGLENNVNIVEVRPVLPPPAA